ncbi:Calx-beta domain-containing protein, partial [Bacillus sp. ISL-45]|uniref:Calx-beta domain-containing protein n=1 Tax=Bacillus sp. ISL-45 TaxID=2819128 RepID=UPI001BE83865
MRKIAKSFFVVFLINILLLPNFTFALEAWLSPKLVKLNLAPNENAEFNLTFTTGTPPVKKLDVVFVFDTTGSMGGEIENAKSRSIEIMNNISSKVEDTTFGVASFRDYPSSYDYSGYSSTYGGSTDVPFYLDQTLTNNISIVSASIQKLYASGGSDWPESYTRALHEVSKSSMRWREDSKKVIILIGDAPTHDSDYAGYNFGVDPGEDGIAGTDDDLNFETVVNSLRDKEMMVLALQAGSSVEAEATLKGASIGFSELEGTNGQYYALTYSSEVSSKVIEMVSQEVLNIKELSFNVPDQFKSWFSFSPSIFSDVGPRETRTTKVNVHIPSDVIDGLYEVPISIKGDGYLLDTSYVNITVNQNSATEQSVEFITSNFGVIENDENATLTLMRTGELEGEYSVNYSTLDDTAKENEDYHSSSGTVTFSSGEKFKTIIIPIINNDFYEDKEEFSVILSEPSPGLIMGDPTSATVSIVDDELNHPGILELTSAQFSAYEGDELEVTVQRHSGSDGTVSVNYELIDGSGKAGLDYIKNSGQLIFNEGETTKTFYVNIYSDDIEELDENIYIRLRTPSNGAILGLNSTAELIIKNKFDDRLYVNPTAIDLKPGESKSVEVLFKQADGSYKNVTVDPNVTFESDNNKLLVNNGQILASNLLPPGSYKVIVSYQDVVKQITVNILPPPTVSNIIVNPESIELAPGKSVPFTVTAMMSDGTSKEVTTDSSTAYEISDSKIVRNLDTIVASNLAPDGLVATVHVSYGGKVATLNVLVKKTEVIVESLAANPTDITVAPGKSVPFTITANMSDGTIKNVTLDSTTKYVSSDSRIVRSSGIIVASNTAPDGLTGTVTVTYGGKETAITVLVKKTEVIV